MVRSAAYNILQNRIYWEDTNVLDVFCGTGSYGIEAISRGAKFAGFIDNHHESVEATRMNIEKMHPEKNYSIFAYDVQQLPKADREYDIIFMDPPYRTGIAPKVIASLKAGGWVAKDALVFVEDAEREKLDVPEGFEVESERRYGNTQLWILRPVG